MPNRPLVKTWGEPGGQPVILIHGLTGRGLLWSAVAERLAGADYYVLTPDLPGHGTHHPHDHSLAAMAAEIGDLLQQQTGPAVIVGHSLGAVVGWQVAIARPQQVRCLVVEDQPPDRRASSAEGWRDWADAWPRRFESRAEATEFLKHAGRSMAWWEPSLAPEPDGSWGWAFDFTAITDIARELSERDSWDDLTGLSVPTLMIRGADSPHLKPEVAARMARVIEQANLVTVPGADHWVHRNADTYCNVLLEFLGQTFVETKKPAGLPPAT